MTRTTYRNNIKKMLRFVSEMVVVLFCLFVTVMAFQNFKSRQFAISNCVAYGTCCSSVFGMGIPIMTQSLQMGNFTFLALVIMFVRNFTLFCLLIFCIMFRHAFFAITVIAIFALCILMKFRNGFGYLAFGTSLYYDCLSHIRFLSKRQWLEPVGSTILPIGSLYYNNSLLHFKDKSYE